MLADLDRVVVPGLTHWQHPSFFAYFPGNSTYPSILGELATAGLGVQGMSWVTSPACTEVETLMLDWMQRAARACPTRFRIASADRRRGHPRLGQRGDAGLDPRRPLAGDRRASQRRRRHDRRSSPTQRAQAHSSIEKGLRIAGIGTDQFRIVPHDEHFAMRADALRARWSPPTSPPG